MAFLYNIGKLFLCCALVLHGVFMVTDPAYTHVMKTNLKTLATKFDCCATFAYIILRNLDYFIYALGTIQALSFFNIFTQRINFIPALNILVLMILSAINSNPFIEDPKNTQKIQLLFIDLIKNISIIGGLIYFISTQKVINRKIQAKTKSD